MGDLEDLTYGERPEKKKRGQREGSREYDDKQRKKERIRNQRGDGGTGKEERDQTTRWMRDKSRLVECEVQQWKGRGWERQKRAEE